MRQDLTPGRENHECCIGAHHLEGGASPGPNALFAPSLKITMSKERAAMTNWNIETDLIEERKCSSCGQPYHFKAGSIYDANGDSVALFLAEMHDHQQKRLVGLTIVLPVDGKGVKAKKNFVSLIL